MKVPAIVLVVAIVCLTLLELYAMNQGIDGVLFTVVVSAIALVVGVEVRQIKEVLKGLWDSKSPKG